MNKDAILAKTSEVLERLSRKHIDSMEAIRATYRITTASYIRWHDKDERAKQFEARNRRASFGHNSCSTRRTITRGD